MDLGWFSYLARTVPPADLARAVGARARRLFRPETHRFTPGEERRPAWPPRFMLADARPTVIDPRAREATARLLRERFPQACLDLLREAEAARGGRLPLFGRLVDCQRRGMAAADAVPIDFEADPFGDSRYDVRLPGTQIDVFVQGTDAKAAWEVGRLTHLWRFGQARWLAETAAERSAWARAWLATLRQFREDCPVGMGVQWSCAMEVSARAMHVALTFALVQDDPEITEDEEELLLEMLHQHGSYIEGHLEDTGAVRTNHFAADLVGLVVISALFPDLPKARRWRELHGAALWREIPRQCRADGTHFESALGYQRLCAELFLAALLSARAADLSVPRGVESAVAGLFRSAASLLKPSGRLPQVGDFDSVRGLPLQPRAALDCSYLPGLGAAALGDASIASGEALAAVAAGSAISGAAQGSGAAPGSSSPGPAEGCPPEVVWLFGPQGAQRLESLRGLPRANVRLQDAGLAVLRAGPGWLCLSAGPNGQGGLGGHAHNDKNSVELSWGELDLIVDRGTFVYARDCAERNRRRATASHSTVQVDGVEQNRIDWKRLFALADHAHARLLRLDEGPHATLAVGEHHGYLRLRPGAIHQRQAMLFGAARAAGFCDDLLGEGEHVLESRFFVPHADVRQRPASPDEIARLGALRWPAPPPSGLDPARCFEVRAGGRPVALFAFAASQEFALSLAETDVSPGYHETAPARVLTLRTEGNLPARLWTAVLIL